ncbi:MAG TPA: HAD-IA family hydrolase [Beijerinckiaceae bacterium]|nr:HAD-IA family hydrolase [Beijerinckiaceae bacterium]
MTATLLFDLDGTLAETDWAHLKAFEIVLGDHGIDIDEAIFKARVVGRSNLEIGAHFFPDMTAAEQKAICDHKEAVYREIVGRIEPVPGLLALLDWADRHDIRCGVVTNAPRLNADHILVGLGLADRFASVVCGQELPESKPHPLPYLTGLAELGGDAAISVAFEDSPSGLSAAVAAGLPVIGMTTNLAAAEVLAAGATMAASDFTDAAMLAFVRARTGRQ